MCYHSPEFVSCSLEEIYRLRGKEPTHLSMVSYIRFILAKSGFSDLTNPSGIINYDWTSGLFKFTQKNKPV